MNLMKIKLNVIIGRQQNLLLQKQSDDTHCSLFVNLVDDEFASTTPFP